MGFSIKKQLISFRYAFAGIVHLLSTQHNAWIQSALAILVIAMGFFFKISPIEWCIVLLCIGTVLSLEAVNTSIEKLADTVHPGKHEGIRIAKDAAAGAVLIASFIALIIGLIIFAPRFLALV